MEKDLNKVILRCLKGYDPIRVENAALPGTPDINCTLGWIESKWMEHPPNDPDALFKIPHFTPQQRAWLMRRYCTDTKCWLILQVAKNYFVFQGNMAADYLGKCSYSQLYDYSMLTFVGSIDADRLTQFMRLGY